MPVRQARKLLPRPRSCCRPTRQLYARASRALHEILRIYAPVIEPRGYGHAFLDLTGTGRLFGPAVDVAARVQREVRERLRLPLSVGVAANKLVSQAATTVVKPEPLLEVPGGAEAGFLAPHPLDVLPDLHPRMRSRLDDYQLELIGEVAAIPESALCAVFGGAGRTLRARARGIDPRPVLPPEQQAEFHVAHTLATDTNDLGVLHPLLRVLSERLGRRLRQRGLAAGRLRVEAHLRRPHRRRAGGAAPGRDARRRAVGGRPPGVHPGQRQAARGAERGAHARSHRGGGGAAGAVGGQGCWGAEAQGGRSVGVQSWTWQRSARRARRREIFLRLCALRPCASATPPGRPRPHPRPLRHPGDRHHGPTLIIRPSRARPSTSARRACTVPAAPDWRWPAPSPPPRRSPRALKVSG